MSALFVAADFLNEFEPPELAEDALFFVVAHSELQTDDEGDDVMVWVEDRTRVTDSPIIAAAWALVLTGVSDDGRNPDPLARITAFAVDPIDAIEYEDQLLPGESVAMYVTMDAEFIAPHDPEFEELDSECAAWLEIIKLFGNGPDADDADDAEDETAEAAPEA
jgi:hypothetical protein